MADYQVPQSTPPPADPPADPSNGPTEYSDARGYDSASAADVIRQKLEHIYATEPNAAKELAESEATTRRSKHQQFMHELSTSGKDLASIQTDWHNYYIGLSDSEKHQVWQEFYSTSTTRKIVQPITPQPETAHNFAEHKHEVVTTSRHKAQRAKAAKRPKRDLRSPQAIRSAIRDSVTANGQLTPKHHLQSLLFGLGMGTLVLFVFLFGFFNEVIIAPFIQPSRATAATPIIVDSTSVAPTGDPQVIIPKINVQIPVDYTQTTTDEKTIETALDSGIVHYPTTVKPGEQGNAAFFGHSSNNIFNKGKYKFAFVLLHTLVPGDTFYLSYNGKMYVYKVISKTVVEPSQVEVLGPVEGHASTATLITCDPPGTSLKRLVVVGEQISPDPSGNQAAAEQPTISGAAAALPGNGPTLANRLMQTPLGKTIAILAIVAAMILTIRWVNKPQRS